MIDPADRDLVRASYQRLKLRPEAFAIAFYANLFRAHPAVRDLFDPDIAPQARKLSDTLGTLVRMLDKPDAVMPAMTSLGQRHVAWGARPEHYDLVGQVLIETLATEVRGWTPAHAAAWSNVYAAVAGAMREGAKRTPVPAGSQLG